MAKYSIVIPCYKSSKTIEKVVRLTVEEFERIGIPDYEFVLVNDCSPDEGATRKVLFDMADRLPYVKVVDLGRNGGQHNATMAGLNYASGDFIISMDDDMQTHPSQIIKLKEKLDEGYDLVYGFYGEKKESLFRRMGSLLNHLTVRLLIHKPKWLKTSSFWIMRKYVRDYAIRYRHPYVHLQGVFLRVTRNIACVQIQHFDREVGTSGYTLKKLVQLYSNIVGFSLMPLHLVQYLGYFFAAAGFILDVVTLIRKLLRSEIASGWSSLVGLICFFSGIILIALGVVGSYIGRLYTGQTNTPQYIVRETRNLDSGKEETSL